MVYLDPQVLHQLHDDTASFIAAASRPSSGS
jgi:hypothetical protein